MSANQSSAVTHIHDVSLTLEQRHAQRAARADAGRQDVAHAAHGRARRSDERAACWSTARTSPASRCGSASVAMVYQQFINYPSLSVYENIASPLRVHRRPREEIEQRVREAARAAEARALSRPPPAAAVGRPAAAHGPRPRARQGRRAGAARRAARQPRLQAARGAARGTAAHLRGLGRDLRLRHHRAGGGAAARRQHGDPVGGPGHAVRPTPRRLSPSARPRDGAGLLRSAAQHVGVEKQGGSVTSPAACRRRPPALCRARRRRYASASAPTTSSSASGIAGAIAITATVSVTEITGSESFVHLDVGDASPGSRCCRACTSSSPGHRSMLFSIPHVFVFDAAGRLSPRPARRRRRGERWPASTSSISPTPTRQSGAPPNLRGEGDDDHVAAGRRLRAARPLGLRQDHAAQHHLRARDAVARTRPLRRPRRDRLPTEARNIAQVFQFPSSTTP